MKKTLLFLALLCLGMQAAAQPILERLRSLEGVCSVSELPAGPFEGKYEVFVTQPLDWRDPAKGSFEQRVVVMHVGCDRPTVLITQGYDANMALREQYRDELSALFDTNIVFVEHRYFDKSAPEPLDWQYLTAENSACDLHRLNALFRTLYPGKWIASGISKGGTTTMLYAAWFPGDADIYVPYVGPLCKGAEDSRFTPFLRKVGTPADRETVRAFQRELLARREALLPGFEACCKEKGYTFRLPIAEIYDYCVLEYGFSFWQWGWSTADIPALDAPDEGLLAHLIERVDPDYFSEGTVNGPFFVQAARELGYYPYDTKPLKKELSLRSTKDYLRRIFLPAELRREQFDPSLYRKVKRYLKRNDPKMIFIYGGNDPWTAPGAGWVAELDKRNMKVFVEPGGSHRTRISTLPDSMRREAVATLRRWLEE